MQSSQAGHLRDLRARARAALARAGGELSAAPLARELFGAAPRGPWQMVLDTLLNGDPSFVRTSDGWRLASRDGEEIAVQGAFVAMAIAATGLDPSHHRIVRVSAIRVERGRPAARFDAVLNPRRRLAAYLREAIRISEEDPDDAPPFSAVADELRQFLADRPVVALGARWHLAMLQAELGRADLPGFDVRAVELDSLAASNLPRTAKPSLAGLAQHLGFEHPRPNFPPADAEITARVAARLFEMVPDGMSQVASPIASRARSESPASWLIGEFPDGPGVYVVDDADGNALYVGKAQSLRRRLAAYRAKPLGLDRQLGGLIARACSLRVIETASDLEALLLEASLIRQHRPPFNVQRRVRPTALYIRAAPHDRVPKIHVVRSVGSDGATYLGPYASERVTRSQIAVAREVYPDAGLRRLRDPLAQRDAVLAALRLLAGQKSEAVAVLRASMRRAAQIADSPALERARKTLRLVLSFEPRPSVLLGAPADQSILVLEPARPGGSRRAHLIRRGTLMASGDLPDECRSLSSDEIERAAASLVPRNPPCMHEEEINIVLRWLGGLETDHAVIRVARGSNLR